MVSVHESTRVLKIAHISHSSSLSKLKDQRITVLFFTELNFDLSWSCQRYIFDNEKYKLVVKCREKTLR